MSAILCFLGRRRGTLLRSASTSPPSSRLRLLLPRLAAVATIAVGCLTSAQAVDFGPFSLTGFAKAEVLRVSDLCPNNRCQRDSLARKDFVWADELIQGSTFGPASTTVSLFQPYLGANFDLGGGFRAKGMLSQRWRDGREDFKGFLYDRSVGLEHENWGVLSVGAMTTRAWHMADFPFGTDVGLADAWASSGSGYGLLTRAVRLTSRTFDLLEGDVVVELTHDRGERGWTQNKPRFTELWLHYGSRDLSIDMMFQNARNGTPSAFTHGPFTGPFYDSRFDSLMGSNGQGLAMVMARWRYTTRLEWMAGVRANRWSGAYAHLLQPASANPEGFDVWNFPFNVDWSRDLGGGLYKGFSARSTDMLAGARYLTGKWAISAAVLRLGSASTNNPMERGQSNTATIMTAGASYEVMKGLRLQALAGRVSYGRLGLSPLSMPSNSAFTNIDSRLSRSGHWVGTAIVYTF